MKCNIREDLQNNKNWRYYILVGTTSNYTRGREVFFTESCALQMLLSPYIFLNNRNHFVHMFKLTRAYYFKKGYLISLYKNQCNDLKLVAICKRCYQLLEINHPWELEVALTSAKLSISILNKNRSKYLVEQFKVHVLS